MLRPRPLQPAVDIRLTCVVGGQRKQLAAVVLVEQIAQVVAAVGDVHGRLPEVGDRERGAAGQVREELGRLGLDLHQTLGAGRRCAGVELRLGVDHRRDQSRVKLLGRGFATDDPLVLQRQTELGDRPSHQR